MANPPLTFHPRLTIDEPPRKRAKSSRDGRSCPTSDILPNHSLASRIMAQTRVTTPYIPHASLDTISNKIKKLQSDLSEAANGQCFGPGKGKVLDCKHDVDVLADMVKELEFQNAWRKKSLDMLVEASIDQLFDEHVARAKKVVDENTKLLIMNTLRTASHRQNIKDAIKESLNNEPDMLVNFKIKFERHFDNALADAVSRFVAGNVLSQFGNI